MWLWVSEIFPTFVAVHKCNGSSHIRYGSDDSFVSLFEIALEHGFLLVAGSTHDAVRGGKSAHAG